MAHRLGVLLLGIDAPGYESLALRYLEATVLADPRLDVAVRRMDVDTNVDPWWIVYRLLAIDPQPDVVALSVMCWTARIVGDVIRLLKTLRPDVFIVVGGPEAGPLAEQYLREHGDVDAVVRDEGEFAFADLLHTYARGGDVASTSGVTARDGDVIRSGPDREPIIQMDSIPSPFLRQDHPTDGSAYVETYRGCPHGCSYCFEGKGSARIRSYSWDRIAQDIEAVATTPGMRSFSFIDPVFNLTDDRLSRMADILEPYTARGIRLHTIEVDIERVTPGQAHDLRRAGVASVECGPQTVGASALSECGRAFDPTRFAAGVRACRDVGIVVESDLIVGLPHDTPGQVIDSMEFAISLDPGKVQMSTLHVLPGTDLWDRADQLGLSFDSQAPHEILSTPSCGFADLRRLEVLGNACTRAYHARLRTRREP